MIILSKKWHSPALIALAFIAGSLKGDDLLEMIQVSYQRKILTVPRKDAKEMSPAMRQALMES